MTLQVADLSVARGGVTVLAGVSFELPAGQALVLRGPNGSGKTTLLRTIAGLQPELAGRITGAEDQIAYAGHSDGLKAMLTVAENLSFWAAVFGFSGGIDAALAAYNLGALRGRFAGQLSAGQKRRLGLARLAVTGRKLWVLDEPTVSLDAASVQLFSGAVARHLAAGGSALMATHIDLGLQAQELDVTAFKPLAGTQLGASEEAFL